MLLEMMDEKLDIKPKVVIEGKQLELLKLDSAASGQKFQMACMATITAINQETGEDGIAYNRITFELSAIELIPEEKQLDLAEMYPNSPMR